MSGFRLLGDFLWKKGTWHLLEVVQKGLDARLESLNKLKAYFMYVEAKFKLDNDADEPFSTTS